MPDDFDSILDEAEALTNTQLRDRISSLTRLTADDVQSLCPKKEDKKALAELMSIVNSAASENAMKKQLVANIEHFSGVILKILSKVI